MKNIQLIETVEKALFWALRNNQIYVIMANDNNEDEPYYITGFSTDYEPKNDSRYIITIDPITARNYSAKKLVDENSHLTD